MKTNGIPITDRAYGEFLEERRSIITLRDAKKFIEKNEETELRRPAVFFFTWNSMSHMTIINIARSAALWQEKKEEFILSSMEKGKAIQMINEIFTINGMAAQKKGLTIMTDYSSTYFSATMASSVQLQLCINNTLAEFASMSDSEGKIPVWVDDCIVKKYFVNKNTRQEIPTAVDEDDEAS